MYYGMTSGHFSCVAIGSLINLFHEGFGSTWGGGGIIFTQAHRMVETRDLT